MKEILKSRVLLVLLTALICIGGTVLAETTIQASEIGYKTTTVDKALDNLYDKADSLGSLTKTVCTYTQEGSYGNQGEVGALYDCEVGPNIHKNFYILEVRNKDVDLIMDRNLTDFDDNKTVSWNTAMKYIDNNNLKTTWSNILNIDLPKAQVIANVIGLNRIVTDDYVDVKICVNDVTKNSCSGVENKQKSWLYNYTVNCDTFGCDLIDSQSLSTGYWTRDLFYEKKWAYDIINGNFYNTSTVWDGDLGVRPVITVLKSNLSN